MKANWQTKKLGEVAAVHGGGTPPTNIPEYFQGNINWYSPREIPKEAVGYLPESERKISESAKQFTTISGMNSVLLTSRATIGTVGVLTTPSGYSQGIKGIEPTKDLDPWYLANWLRANKDEIINKASGTTFKEISTNEVKALEILIPPIKYQKQIVKKLEELLKKIEKIKKNTEKNLQNSRELFESYLDIIFSNPGNNWEKKKLNQICAKITDGTHQTPTYCNSGVIFLSSKNVTSGKIDWENVKYIDNKQHLEMYKRATPQINDILLAKNGTTGIAAIVDKDVIFDIYVSLALLKPLNIIDPLFLLYFINSPFAKKQFNKRLKGSGVPNLHLEEIREVEIYFPKLLSEQKAIVKKLNDLSQQTKNLEESYKKKLVDLETLKKSILKKAFEGELVTSPSTFSNSQNIAVSPFIRNQVHAAIINQVVNDGGRSTEVAVAKYDHLLQELYGLQLGYNFQTHLFGPFDAQIKRLVASGLGKNNWFIKRNGNIIFGSNINALLSKKSNLYTTACAAMSEMAKLKITKLDTEKIELLSTVCHSIKETNSLVINDIRNFMSTWSTDNNRMKSDKFSMELTKKCLDFVVKNDLYKNLLKTI